MVKITAAALVANSSQTEQQIMPDMTHIITVAVVGKYSSKVLPEAYAGCLTDQKVWLPVDFQSGTCAKTFDDPTQTVTDKRNTEQTG